MPLAPPLTSDRGARALRWAFAALATSGALIVLKGGAWWISRSDAVLSDVLETLVHVVTGSVAVGATWLSSRPRDAEHPYGHGRVEYFSAALEGGMLLAAGVGVFAVVLLRGGQTDDLAPGVGAFVSLIIAAITFTAGQLIARAGQRIGSPSVRADGIHLRADGVTTLGTALALGVVSLTGWRWIDPVAALLIGVWLVHGGYRLLRDALGALMDEADPALLERVAATLSAAREPGWLAPHWARIQRFGMHVHIDLHLVLPRFWELERAHDVATRLEEKVRDEYGELSEIMVHLEPCRPASCSSCDLPACPLREAEFVELRTWTGESIRRRHRGHTYS